MSANVAGRLTARNQVVLSRSAAASLRGAACKGEQQLWDTQEALHARAETSAEALAAADPLLEFCSDCPVLRGCREWAAGDGYTGIAGGLAFKNGRARPADWTPARRAERKAG